MPGDIEVTETKTTIVKGSPQAVARYNSLTASGRIQKNSNRWKKRGGRGRGGRGRGNNNGVNNNGHENNRNGTNNRGNNNNNNDGNERNLDGNGENASGTASSSKKSSNFPILVSSITARIRSRFFI
jgi:hypothetical protein